MTKTNLQKLEEKHYHHMKETLRRRVNEFELSDDLTKLLSVREFANTLLTSHGFNRAWAEKFREQAK